MLVRWSKVIQFKQRTLYVPIPKIEHSALCPLQAYHNALTLAPDTRPTDPAFITYISGKESPFTYTKFAVKLRTTLQNAGISPDNFSEHSFRRGGATFAMRSGVPLPLIECQGDWASDAYERYLVTTLKDRLLAVAIKAKAIKGLSM